MTIRPKTSFRRDGNDGGAQWVAAPPGIVIKSEGYSCAGVMRAFNIQKRTVQAHLTNIHRKLKVGSVAELIHLLRSVDPLQ
jgi:hypothetical protein